LLLLVEDFQRLAPGRLLAAVDLAKVQDPPLHHAAGLQTAALFNAVVAVLLAILDPPMTAQKHAHQQNARTLGR